MTVAAAQKTGLLLFPRQRRFVADRRAFPAYIGGIGSGKTFAGAAKLLTRIAEPGVGTVYAPTYGMLRDATFRTVVDVFDTVQVPYVHTASDFRIAIPSTGHEILFRSLDNPNNLRGPNLHWAWVDEAAYATAEAWQIVKGRVRAGSNPQAWITSTPKGRNWIWQEWERDGAGDDTDETHPLWRVRTVENPELPPGFAEGLGYAGRFAAQELDGEFVAFDGLVYPGFSRARNVATNDVTGWRTVVAVDVGTRNPTAILTVHQAGDGRVHVSREVYRRNLSSADIVAAIREAVDAIDAETVVIDPSAAGYILELQRLGYHVTRGDHAITEGIGRVTTALADGLTVSPTCTNLVSEFESYRYPDGTRTESDKPIKDHDHALDALRYAVMHLSAPSLAGRLFL